MAAQDQALHTRNYKVKNLKEEGNGLCRMCGKRSETVMPIPSECEKLAQLEYSICHSRFATTIRWGLCKHHGFHIVRTGMTTGQSLSWRMKIPGLSVF